MTTSINLYHFQKSIDHTLFNQNLSQTDMSNKVNQLFENFLSSIKDLDNQNELEIEAREYKNDALADISIKFQIDNHQKINEQYNKIGIAS